MWKKSNFSNEFLYIHKIAIRAVEDGVLNKKFEPSACLTWAKGLEIPIPSDSPVLSI